MVRPLRRPHIVRSKSNAISSIKFIEVEGNAGRLRFDSPLSMIKRDKCEAVRISWELENWRTDIDDYDDEEEEKEEAVEIGTQLRWLGDAL